LIRASPGIICDPSPAICPSSPLIFYLLSAIYCLLPVSPPLPVPSGQADEAMSTSPNPAAANTPAWLRPHSNGVLLRLHVQPRAGRTEVCGEFGDRLKLRVAGPPVDNKANREIIAFLAKALAVSRGEITIVRGETGRDKDVLAHGVTAAAAAAALRT